MHRRPIIGVTGPDKGGLIAWLMTALAVARCGATAVRVRPSKAVDHSQLDAVIIGGGTDVDPFHYGEHEEPDETDDEPQHRTLTGWLLDWLVGLVLGVFRVVFSTRSIQGYDPDRDHMEKELVQYALYHDLPVLGICRGAQLMNVVLGGSLHRNIGHFYTEETRNIRSILPRKMISITPASHLHEILATRSCFVNALHNQSIKQLGDDVVVSAVEPNGVVQAIEKCEHRFFIGVQWHPEYMPQSRTQQGLFRGVTRCAAERRMLSD